MPRTDVDDGIFDVYAGWVVIASAKQRIGYGPPHDAGAKYVTAGAAIFSRKLSMARITLDLRSNGRWKRAKSTIMPDNIEFMRADASDMHAYPDTYAGNTPSQSRVFGGDPDEVVRRAQDCGIVLSVASSLGVLILRQIGRSTWTPRTAPLRRGQSRWETSPHVTNFH